MRRFLRGLRGFTLVEILIAVAILVIMAGIAIPVVAHLTSGSETGAAAAELSNVQAAIDTMMSAEGLGSFPTTSPLTSTADALVDTTGEATGTMSAFPYSDGDYALCPASGTKYLRTDTKGTYYVSTDGTVTQQTTGY